MEEKIRQEKKQNGFVRILKILFVKNNLIMFFQSLYDRAGFWGGAFV